MAYSLRGFAGITTISRCLLRGGRESRLLGGSARSEKQIILFYSKVPRGFKPAKEKNKHLEKLAGAFFLVVPITTFCLGVWQYNRRSWKIEKIKELDYKARKSTPQPLPSQFENNEDLEYRRIQVRGSFDHSKEMFIGPRSLIDSQGGSGGGVISTDVKTGWHVITPFLVENGPTILVNRGWVPREKLDPSQRSGGQISGPVDIVGIYRLNEDTSSLTPQNQVEKSTWFSRDVTGLASKLGTEPVFLDLDLESGRYAADRGGPIGGQTRVSLRNDHVQYMLTWWGISLATTLLWLKRFVL